MATSNSDCTPGTPNSPSPGNTPQSPAATSTHPPPSTIPDLSPITTKLIPPSMISMATTNLNNPSQTHSNTNTKKRKRKRKHRSKSRSRSRSHTPIRKSKRQRRSHTHSIMDLTQTIDTPLTSDSEADIQIIDTVTAHHSNHTNTNTNTDIQCIDKSQLNFEKYTLDGIGGKLLRKAGWDGNKHNLYQSQNGPIQIANKYSDKQRRKVGLGYTHTNNHNRNCKRNYPTLASMHINPLRLTTQKRVAFPGQMRVRPIHSMVSNTVNTAIVIDDESDGNDSDVVLVKCVKKVIDYDAIIAGLSVESASVTRKWIAKQFRKRLGGVSVSKMVVSVVDSYSQCKIAVPVRGKRCNHLQPFDAKCFLSRARKYQRCTQCNASLRERDLVRSEYFEAIFQELSAGGVECAQIEIMRDGQWEVVGSGGKDEICTDKEGSVSDANGGNEECVIVLSSGAEESESEKELEVVDLLESSEERDSQSQSQSD